MMPGAGAEAGAFCVVLEGMPTDVAGEITARGDVPTGGSGAGPQCDGQVLVLHDMLGITKDFSPRFLRRYAEVGDAVEAAVEQYVEDVRNLDFPNDEERY